jgi:hypothetical protein
MRFELGYGVGFDRNGKALDAQHVAEVQKLILVEACRRFGGCNILPGQGAWLDGDNLVVEESRVLVFDTGAAVGSRPGYQAEIDAHELAQFIGHLLNQKAVHVVQTIGLRTYNLEVKVYE